MRKKAMQQRMKSWGSFCLILFLLPYVVTVFIHGKDLGRTDESGQVTVKVRKAQEAVGTDVQMGNTDSAVSVVSSFFHLGEQTGSDPDAEDSRIVEMPWEEYFVGVMAQETPADAEPEFLKAQAVLIRTKLYQELKESREDETGSGTEESVSDENHSGEMTSEEGGAEDSQSEDGKVLEENGTEMENQPSLAEQTGILEERYLEKEEMEKKFGASEYENCYKKLRQAMEETENQVLLYQDAYAWVPFHQSSNGMTRSAQEVLGQDTWPYLALRECPLDKEAEDEMQISTFEYKEVQTKCQSFLVAVEEKDAGKTYQFSDFEIVSYDSAGYVSELRIGDTVCTGDQFRDALSLASSAFSLKDAEGKLRITTTGKGHGLGMSQWTAQQMAKEGKTYEEILQYFFEGTVVADGGALP